MRFLINTSNIKKSGALQVALSFIEEIREFEHDFFIILSSNMEPQIKRGSYPSNFQFFTLDLVTPFNTKYVGYVKLMNKLEAEFKPDCVLSIFAPAYWTPQAPHISGFAHGWAINPDARVVKDLTLIKRMKHLLETGIKKYFIKRNAQYFIVETEETKRRLSKYFNIPIERIAVVGNTANHYFLNYNAGNTDTLILKPRLEKEYRLITIASNFSHKNLKFIEKTSTELRRRGYDYFYFYVTISDEDYKNLYGINDNIINIGTIKASQCPSVYKQCDALFLPTLLECFSASYPEAMIMSKPILTSNLSFAIDICGDVATYFDPYNEIDAVDKIIMLMNDNYLKNEKIEMGLDRVKHFPTPNERAKKYIKICESLVNTRNSL